MGFMFYYQTEGGILRELFNIVFDPVNHTKEVLIAVLFIFLGAILFICYKWIMGVNKARLLELENKAAEIKAQQDREKTLNDLRESERAERIQERADDREDQKAARRDLLQLVNVIEANSKANNELSSAVNSVVSAYAQDKSEQKIQYSDILNTINDIPEKTNDFLSSKVSQMLEAGCLVIDGENKVISWNTKGLRLLFPDLVDKKGGVKDHDKLCINEEELGKKTSLSSLLPLTDFLAAIRKSGQKKADLLEVKAKEASKWVRLSAHPFLGESGNIMITFWDLGVITNRSVVGAVNA
jgi:PAS domain-containing protein